MLPGCSDWPDRKGSYLTATPCPTSPSLVGAYSRTLVHVEPEQVCGEVDERSEHEDDYHGGDADRGTEQPSRDGADELDEVVAPLEGDRRIPREPGRFHRAGAQVGTEVERDPDGQDR